MPEVELPPKSKLELQIEAEAKELKEVPKIPIQQFFGGPTERCHLCGRVVPASELRDFDTHIPYTLPRKACKHCHPNRGTHG